MQQVLGDGIAPHLGTIAAALPAVWSRALPGAGPPGAPGAETRLHGALIAVLTHLLRRLPAAAMVRSHPTLLSLSSTIIIHEVRVNLQCGANNFRLHIALTAVLMHLLRRKPTTTMAWQCRLCFRSDRSQSNELQQYLMCGKCIAAAMGRSPPAIL